MWWSKQGYLYTMQPSSGESEYWLLKRSPNFFLCPLITKSSDWSKMLNKTWHYGNAVNPKKKILDSWCSDDAYSKYLCRGPMQTPSTVCSVQVRSWTRAAAGGFQRCRSSLLASHHPCSSPSTSRTECQNHRCCWPLRGEASLTSCLPLTQKPCGGTWKDKFHACFWFKY